MKTKLRAGDVFYTPAGQEYHLFKVLAVDDVLDCYHVRCYVPVAAVPTAAEVAGLPVAVGHSPISTDGFGEPVLLGHEAVLDHELEGYHYYLRAMRGAPAPPDPDSSEVDQAIQYFHQGLALSDEQRHWDAIAAYTEAVELVPAFYEALDNCAFCFMDLGLWERAIAGFEQSLAVNPDNALAEFSIGECYFNLGDDARASAQFEKALALDPTYFLALEFLQKVAARTGR